MTTNTPDHPQHSGREEMIEEIVDGFRWFVGAGACLSEDHAYDYLRTTLHSLVERVERETREDERIGVASDLFKMYEYDEGTTLHEALKMEFNKKTIAAAMRSAKLSGKNE